VRHLALRWLLDEAEESPAVRAAGAAAMRADPIAARLETRLRRLRRQQPHPQREQHHAR
jgi:hypothetical protein